MKVREILEKWGEEAHINPEKKGMFDDKTVVQLEAELAALRKAGPHPEGSAGYTKMKELSFAIRAKKAAGGKWAGVDTDKDEEDCATSVMMGEAFKKPAWLTNSKVAKVKCSECNGKGRVRSGSTGRMVDCHPCLGAGYIPREEMEDNLNERWKHPGKVKHTGRNTNKSVAKLKGERSKAKKSGNTKSLRQKNFAIRAKTGWGKVNK